MIQIKNKKIFKIVAVAIGAALICAVLIGVLNGLIGKGEWNLGWTDYRYDDSHYKVGEGTIAAPKLEHIDLDWIDGNVSIVICQDAFVSVSEKSPTELSEKTSVHWYVSEDGKSLSIKYRGSSSFWGRTKDKEKDLILRIPEKLMGQLQTLTVNAISSDVTFSGVSVADTKITTATGDIRLQLPGDAVFSLTYESQRDEIAAIDFPVRHEGNTYICGSDGIRIFVKTNSGKLAVTSK